MGQIFMKTLINMNGLINQLYEGIGKDSEMKETKFRQSTGKRARCENKETQSKTEKWVK